ncbi:MAG TPA: hypothetical protein VK801_01280 [Caulobacteraceae bacterium]|jgi:hypothetical protein|nr:hypothetical protein [Caulobacteraceae bacterium]
MADFYAFISPAELASSDDPVEILRSANTIDELLEHKSFNPDQTAFWARAKVHASTGEDEILNQKTGKLVIAAVCGLDR